jgi:hypothetical protein
MAWGILAEFIQTQETFVAGLTARPAISKVAKLGA